MADNRSSEEREESEQRRAEVMRRRRQGETFAAIGSAMGVTAQRAHQIYTAALREIPADEVALYRAEQAERLDEMLREAYAVLGRDHITVSNGRIVMAEDGPVLDDGPKLAAIRTILDIEARRAKLLGLDTPVKQQIELDGGVRYEIVGVSVEDLT